MKNLKLTLSRIIIAITLFLAFSCSSEEETQVPIANFEADSNIVYVNNAVQFTDLSENKPDAWLWEFGDGGSSIEQNPSYAYAETGEYVVTLSASNSAGTDTKTMNITVQADFNEGTLKDYDGNVYHYTEIGTQIWMRENLKVTHYPDGTPIPIETADETWANFDGSEEAMCYYTNSPASIYGGLYTHAAALKACPDGWHLPSEQEWQTLSDFVKNDTEDGTPLDDDLIGKKLKSLVHWDDGGNGTDDYGFTGLPGGGRNSFLKNGEFSYKNTQGFWWSNTIDFSDDDITTYILYGQHNIFRESTSYGYTGLSIRCIKD